MGWFRCSPFPTLQKGYSTGTSGCPPSSHHTPSCLIAKGIVCLKYGLDIPWGRAGVPCFTALRLCISFVCAFMHVFFFYKFICASELFIIPLSFLFHTR